MQIVDTSLDAFQSIKPELGSRQAAVFDVIQYLKSPSNAEISRFMGLPINSITGRTNELRKKGLVKDTGKRVCKVTGSEVHVWSVV